MSDYIKPICAMLLPFTGAALGTAATRAETKSGDGKSTWYKALKKPKFQPPNWVFGPVWTGLYGSMGYASYMLWRDGGGFGGKAALPLACYGTQLALNWAWSPLFFKYHKIGLATVEIGAMWVAIAATMATAYEVNPNVTYILSPYLAWVSFASLVSFSVWKLNKDRTD